MKKAADLIEAMPSRIRNHRAARAIWMKGYWARRSGIPKDGHHYKHHRWITDWLGGWEWADAEMLIETAQVAEWVKEEESHPLEFTRVCGNCVCEKCQKKLFEHRQHPTYPWLRITCEGRFVKL